MPAPNPLAFAARTGDLPALQSALSNGTPHRLRTRPIYNPEISAYTGDLTALMHAAAAGQSAAIAFLLSHGADANEALGGDGKAPLIAAAENLRADLVSLLLEHGTDPGKADPRGRTPFGIATRFRNQPVLLALQKPWERNPQRALYNAAQSGDLDGIHTSIARGAQVNLLPKPHNTGGDATALMYASMCGQVAAAALLLIDLGAQVDLATEYGATALHCAISNNHLDVVKLLIECGSASLRIDAIYDGPPLSLAALRGSPEMVAYLIEHGAPVNAIKKWGAALADAVVHDRIDIARVLFAHGADPNSKGPDGRSALEMAEQTGKFRVPEWADWKALFKR